MRQYDSDIIDAVSLSATRKAEKSGGLQRAFSIVLFSFFVVMDLLALMAAASAYGTVTKLQSTNDSHLLSVGPIVSSIRANDTSGGMTSGEGPEGESLVLQHSDSQSTYETRIYLYEGTVVQEYALQGMPYMPDMATTLVESSTFEFSYDAGLLTVTTDGGTAEVALRNLQGGE